MICPVLLIESFRRALTLCRAPLAEDARSAERLTDGSERGGLARSRSAGHPCGSAPSTGGGILRDLQGRPLLPHRILLGHDPLLGHTQNLGEVRADPGEEGGARFRRPHQKPGMMLRENVLGQRPAGRRQLRNPVPRQRCGPSVLHGAGPLRQPKLVDGAARLLGGPVVRTPVGREGTDAPRVTIRRAASTGTARAEARPIRRSCNPSAPSA